MLDKLNALDTKAKIRLFVFTLVLAWCAYCSIGYAMETNFGGLTNNYVDTADVHDVSIDGSDFTWAVLLLGHAVNGMISVVIFFLFCVLLVAEVIFTIIPILLLRFIGIRNSTVITGEEYQLSKYLYYLGIVISIVIGLILTRFSGILNLLILVGVWALLVRIYLSALKMNMLQHKSFDNDAEETV